MAKSRTLTNLISGGTAGITSETLSLLGGMGAWGDLHNWTLYDCYV